MMAAMKKQAATRPQEAFALPLPGQALESDMAAFDEDANPWLALAPEKMPDAAGDFFARWTDPDAILAAFPQVAENFLPFRQAGRLADFTPAERARCMAKSVIQMHSGLPRHLVVEASALCQLRCDFCAAKNILPFRRNAIMGMADFGKLWRHAEFFTHSIDFTGGEPLLNPDLAWLLRLAKRGGTHVSLSTNGMLLDRRRAEEILDARPNSVVVSLDGADARAYEAARPGGDFRLLVDNLATFSRLAVRRPAPRTRLGVRFLATRNNFSQRDDYWRLAGEIGADFALVRHYRIPPDASRLERFRAYQETALRDEPESYYRLTPDNDLAPGKATEGCTRSRHPAYVGSGGEMLACQFFPRDKPVGNAVDQPFAATWFSEAAIRQRRHRLKHGLYPGCRWCPGEWRTEWYEERVFER